LAQRVEYFVDQRDSSPPQFPPWASNPEKHLSIIAWNAARINKHSAPNPYQKNHMEADVILQIMQTEKRIFMRMNV